MGKGEPLPVRNPNFSQSSKLPLFTKGLRFLPKLRNKNEKKVANRPKSIRHTYFYYKFVQKKKGAITFSS
jgi:hypothetical protein